MRSGTQEHSMEVFNLPTKRRFRLAHAAAILPQETLPSHRLEEQQKQNSSEFLSVHVVHGSLRLKILLLGLLGHFQYSAAGAIGVRPYLSYANCVRNVMRRNNASPASKATNIWTLVEFKPLCEVLLYSTQSLPSVMTTYNPNPATPGMGVCGEGGYLLYSECTISSNTNPQNGRKKQESSE